MTSPTTTKTVSFLQGGGEMGQLTRDHSWAQTPLGPPHTWPLSLRTTLGILLHSAFPMFLFWGEALTCFYNDAFRPSLGNEGKHPAVGQPAKVVWPDTWDSIGPLIEQVMATGEGIRYEDQLLPIFRNGQLEDVYWTFSYSPAYGDDGQIAGVFVTCAETTHDSVSINKLRHSEQRLQNFIRDVSVGVVVLSGRDMRVDVVNDAYARLIGYRADDLRSKPLFSILPNAEAVFRPIIESVWQTDEPLYLYGQPYAVINAAGEPISGYLDLVYQPYKELDGRTTGVIVLCQDVTKQKQAEEAMKASEHRFQAAIAAVQGILWTNNAVGKMEGEQPGWSALTGQRYDEYQGYGWTSVIHPHDVQPTIVAWEEALAERSTFVFEHRVRMAAGHWELFSVRAIPLINADSSIREWVGVHTNITRQREAEEALRESEAKFRSLIEEAPVATCLLVGRDLVIEVANDPILGYWGKDRSTLGQPLAKALPELEGQPFLAILDRVFTTGETYSATAEKTTLLVDGVLGTYFFDYICKPLFTDTGDVYAIMDMAVDVTEQVLARQKIEEAESALRGAIEMAELGTWQIDLVRGRLDYSQRLRNWFGIGPDELITPDRAYKPVVATDRPRVEAAIAQAMAPGSDGIYDIEYTVDPAEAGRERVLHIQGRAFFTDNGAAYRLSGTARDVTRQRQMQLELERNVAERTQQLQASVRELERSNQNLQQFAYVASHDLQEPLRKIQSFGNLLTQQYGNQLGNGSDLLNRMQASASRMSTLIHDLLTFSRISTRQEATARVPLATVVANALLDLDLRIQETGAVIEVASLPTIQGDPSQLGQLFQNLLSNALKFTRPGVSPRVQIMVQTLPVTALPNTVQPTREAPTYYRIDVTDNGIGFDEKYADRIFQVFQRLHGRGQFAGTGIGLAICEKVTANHGGAIAVASQPDQGATFSLYFPVPRTGIAS